LVEGFRVQGIILATTLNPQPAAQQPGGVGQAKSKK
jgi:hypothetical protein